MKQLELYAAGIAGGSARRVIVLVGCGAKKLEKRAPARELYVGNLFQAASRYAQSLGVTWRILSARYGTVLPETMLAPYDQRMYGGQLERAQWGRIAASGLVFAMQGKADLTVISLAGEPYTEPVFACLEEWGVHCVRPLRGLGLGQRLQWLKSPPSLAQLLEVRP